MNLSYEQRRIGLVSGSERMMEALSAVRALGLPSWCTGTGAIRSLVWDALHGYDRPTPLDDVDVVYFDAAALDSALDALHQRRRCRALPGIQWEVTNQAIVHHGFRESLGQDVAPLQSLAESIATWPEYATCVGVNLSDAGRLSVMAPHGLADLLGLRVRHNPARVSVETFRQRVRSKRLQERWPLLTVCDVR